MATFVLIHGAWHGGWCWARVTDRLRAQGHTVFAPSLSGLAEHGNRIDAAIGHDVHIEDTTRVIEWNDLDNVVLVGHSYGGTIAAFLAARYLEMGVPHPRAVLLSAPGTGPLKGGRLTDYQGIPADA